MIKKSVQLCLDLLEECKTEMELSTVWETLGNKQRHKLVKDKYNEKIKNFS